MADVERVLAQRTAKINGGSGEPLEVTGATGRTVDPNVLDSSKPSPTPATLEWRPLVPGMEAILSACGRYSVARARVNGKPSYQAWVRLPTPHLLGEPQESAEAAKQIVTAHALGSGT